MADSLRVRPAVSTDKIPVLEFCKNTWSWGDYLPEVWDQWLKDRSGRLVVAIVNGRPVGVAHAKSQNSRIVWLEGVRVHPSYRGLGIAGKLNDELCKFALQKGAKLVRLCTTSTNTSSQKHLSKVKFELLAKFQRFETVNPIRKPPGNVSLRRKYSTALWKWIRASTEFDLFKEMYSDDGWTWYPLTPRTIRRFTEKRGVLVTGSKASKSCSLFTAEENRLTLGFTAGPVEKIRYHIRYLRYLLSKGEYRESRALIPENSEFTRVPKEEEYERSGKILVYEKWLGEKRGLQSNKAQDLQIQRTS